MSASNNPPSSQTAPRRRLDLSALNTVPIPSTEPSNPPSTPLRDEAALASLRLLTKHLASPAAHASPAPRPSTTPQQPTPRNSSGSTLKKASTMAAPAPKSQKAPLPPSANRPRQKRKENIIDQLTVWNGSYGYDKDGIFTQLSTRGSMRYRRTSVEDLYKILIPKMRSIFGRDDENTESQQEDGALDGQEYDKDYFTAQCVLYGAALKEDLVSIPELLFMTVHVFNGQLTEVAEELEQDMEEEYRWRKDQLEGKMSMAELQVLLEEREARWAENPRAWLPCSQEEGVEGGGVEEDEEMAEDGMEGGGHHTEEEVESPEEHGEEGQVNEVHDGGAPKEPMNRTRKTVTLKLETNPKNTTKEGSAESPVLVDEDRPSLGSTSGSPISLESGEILDDSSKTRRRERESSPGFSFVKERKRTPVTIVLGDSEDEEESFSSKRKRFTNRKENNTSEERNKTEKVKNDTKDDTKDGDEGPSTSDIPNNNSKPKPKKGKHIRFESDSDTHTTIPQTKSEKKNLQKPPKGKRKEPPQPASDAESSSPTHASKLPKLFHKFKPTAPISDPTIISQITGLYNFTLQTLSKTQTPATLDLIFDSRDSTLWGAYREPKWDVIFRFFDLFTAIPQTQMFELRCRERKNGGRVFRHTGANENRLLRGSLAFLQGVQMVGSFMMPGDQKMRKFVEVKRERKENTPDMSAEWVRECWEEYGKATTLTIGLAKNTDQPSK